MKIDRRRRLEHLEEEKMITDKTDEDTKVRRKDLEQEMCVTTWNVNKSSAQDDFLRDMAQCQANVVMSQETQNWQEDGPTEELGWTLLKEKEGKAAIAVKKKNSNLLRYLSQKHKMDTCCSWMYPLSLDVLATHLARRGEANLEEQYKT